MAFQVRPFEPADYLATAPALHPWLGTPGCPSADRIAQHYAEGPAFSGLLDGALIGCAGVLVPWPGLGVAWAVVTDLGRQHPHLLHRQVVRHLRRIIDAYGLQRVEATVLAGAPAHARWVEAMGFTREAHKAAWGPHGEAAETYVLFPVQYEARDGIEMARRAGRDFVRVEGAWRPVMAGGFDFGIGEAALAAGALSATEAGIGLGAGSAVATAGATTAAAGVTTSQVLTAASLAGTLVGTGVTAYGQAAQGAAIARGEKLNASFAERQAAQARAAAEVAAQNKETQFRHILATQRARVGASGVTTEGSPLLAMMDSAEQAALDVARLRYGGEITGQGLETEATLRRFQGRQARLGGSLAAGASLLTGLGSTGYSLGRRSAA